MRDRSPVKWVERSKTKNADRRTAPGNGATPPGDPTLRRYRVASPPPEYLAAQHPAAWSVPPVLPWRSTSPSSVARLPHTAGQASRALRQFPDADRRERAACDCPAIARGCPHYPFSSSASSPSAIAHARNARAAPRALASSDISSRRRTTRSRLYGNRGPSYVRANSAASSRVRTVTSRTRRRGGSNTKSVMPRKLLFVDRNNQARASLCTIAPHFYTTLYHKYHSYITHLSPISLLYHSYTHSADLSAARRRVIEQIVAALGSFVAVHQSAESGPPVRTPMIVGLRAGLVCRTATAFAAIRRG